MSLRPYQQRAISDLRAAYASGKRAPLLVAPTGSGKTVIAAAIVAGAHARGNRTLFVAPRRELLGQTVRKLADAGITDVRVIQADRDVGDPDAMVTVGSIQTLVLPRWIDSLPPAELVIADEAHHMAADLWGQLATRYATARWLGLSATPERADGRALGDIFDAIVVGATVAELTSAGHLVPCKVWAPREELDTGELAIDPVEAYATHGHGQLAVVFCSTVTHARSVAESFTAAGIPGTAISGSTPATERDRILADWGVGIVRVVANCGVLTEGFDLPQLAVCILARRFGHSGLFLQCVGRVLRPFPEKLQACVVDLCGSVHRHGPPALERMYNLTGKAITAKRDAIRQCPSCGSVFLAADTCPECGEVLPVRPREEPRVTGAGVVDIDSLPRARREYTITIQAKWSAACRRCGGRILPGQMMHWATQAKQATHFECPRPKQLSLGGDP